VSNEAISQLLKGHVVVPKRITPALVIQRTAVGTSSWVALEDGFITANGSNSTAVDARVYIRISGVVILNQVMLAGKGSLAMPPVFVRKGETVDFLITVAAISMGNVDFFPMEVVHF